MEAVVGFDQDDRFWKRTRFLLVALVLCRGLVWLCVLPPFEGWDEYQHVGYVQHVAETGRAAVLGETNVPASFCRAQPGFRSLRARSSISSVSALWVFRLLGEAARFHRPPLAIPLPRCRSMRRSTGRSIIGLWRRFTVWRGRRSSEGIGGRFASAESGFHRRSRLGGASRRRATCTRRSARLAVWALDRDAAAVPYQRRAGVANDAPASCWRPW